MLLPLLAGAVWAAAFYVRPAALPIMVWAALLLPLAPFLTGLMERFRGGTAPDRGLISLKGAGQSLVMAGTFALLMVPWGLRNREVTGSFRIMPAQGGVNIWEYNGRIFTDHFMDEIQGATLLYGNLRNSYIGRLNSPELAEFPEFRDEPEWVRDSILVSRNLRFMMANPGLTVRLISLRFVEMFKPFPLNSFSILYTLAGIVSMFWVLVFLWGGAIRSAFHHGAGGFYLATLVAGYSLMHLLTASGTPHRVAIDFPMAVMAMIGLKYSLLRHRAWRESRNA